MANARTTFVDELGAALKAGHHRREFLKISAMGGMAALLPAFLAGCSDDPEDTMLHSTINFGTPSGSLNVLYATLQMQGDFYARITTGARWPGMTLTEAGLISHLNSYKGTMFARLAEATGDNAVSRALLFDFRAIDFTVRASAMGFAEMIESLGVQAANGAITLAKNGDAALMVAKVASVMARQATAIREMNDYAAAGNAFTGSRASFKADLSSNSLEASVTPQQWYEATDPYYKTDFTLKGL